MINLEAIRRVKQRYEDEWIKFDNVYAIGIGYKRVDGKKTDKMGIVVYTTDKKILADIPEEQRIPQSIDEIPVDVIEGEMPVFYAETTEQQPDTNMYRPMAGGIQICHLHERTSHYYVVTIGTLGMFVKSKDDPENLYALTNWHVLEKEKVDIFQPDYAGSEVTKMLIASESRGAYFESADAGIAKVIMPLENVCPNVILEIGKIAGIYEEEPALGQLVKKRGRTTFVTHGKVVAVDATVSNGTNIFKHQVMVEGTDEQGKKISRSGDSGSIVLTYDEEIEEKNNKVMGLLWGGSEADNLMVYSPIQYVFEALNLEMCE